MNRKDDRLTLEKIIKKYIEKLPSRDKGPFENLFNHKDFDEAKLIDIEKFKDKGSEASDELIRAMYDRLSSAVRDKSAIYERYNDFINYLNKNYSTSIDIKELLPDIPPLKKTERLLNILKVLQGKKISRQKLAENI